MENFNSGLNLLVPSGIEVRNKLNNYNIPVSHEGFGWCSCKVQIPLDSPLGVQKLIFYFKDLNDNSSSQEFSYKIIDKK